MLTFHRPGILGATLFIFFGFLFLYTHTYDFHFDGIIYAGDVEREQLSRMFHPNHLLYSPLGWLWWKIESLFGNPRSIFSLQRMNAFLGALAVAIFFLASRRELGTWRAWGGACVLGASAAFWRLAVDPDCYMPAALFSSLLLGCILLRVRPIVLGICLGVGTLFHQMFVLLWPGFLWWLWVQENDKKTAVRDFIVSSSLMILIGYGFVLFSFHKGSVSDWFVWLLGPAGGVRSGSFVQDVFKESWWIVSWKTNLLSLGRSVADGIISPSSPFLYWGWVGVICASCFLLFRRLDRLGILLIYWIVIQAIFQAFWSPGVIRFRLIYLAPLIFMGISGIPEKFWARSMTILFIGGLFITHLPKRILSAEPQNNQNYMRAMAIGSRVGPNDFFIFTALTEASMLRGFLPYFFPSLRGTSLHGYAVRSKAEDFSGLTAHVMEVLNSEGTVYVGSDLLDHEAILKLGKTGHLSPSAVSSFLDRWRFEKEVQIDPKFSLYKIYLKEPV